MIEYSWYYANNKIGRLCDLNITQYAIILEDKKNTDQSYKFNNYNNYYFIINNVSNLSVVVKVLVKDVIFIKKIKYRLENIRFINFY